jgi:hypothetical protein
VLVWIDHEPLEATTALPTAVAPSSRVMVSPDSPVPVINGVATSVMSSPGVPLSEEGARVNPDGVGGIGGDNTMSSNCMFPVPVNCRDVRSSKFAPIQKSVDPERYRVDRFGLPQPRLTSYR